MPDIQNLDLESASQKNLIVKQYKLYVESYEEQKTRRVEFNHFMFKVNAALAVALYAIAGMVYGVYGAHPLDYKIAKFFIYLTLSIGAALSLYWYVKLISYWSLIDIKQDVIKIIETDLPIKPFTKERETLDNLKKYNRYFRVKTIEKLAPISILVIYAVLSFVVHNNVRSESFERKPQAAHSQPIKK